MRRSFYLASITVFCKGTQCRLDGTTTTVCAVQARQLNAVRVQAGMFDSAHCSPHNAARNLKRPFAPSDRVALRQC